MAYPNILAHRGDGVLQYLSTAELVDLTELVLEKMAADNTVGCLTSDIYDQSSGEPYAINGFYPLYSTVSASNAAAGPGYPSHSHVFDGVTHYMPEGVTSFHGDYVAGTSLGSGNLTAIGTFANRYRVNVQSSGDATITQDDVVLYQNLDTNSVDTTVRPHPVLWDAAINSIQTISNGHLHDLCDEILSYVTSAEGPMSYKLAATAPSGGTWVAVLTLMDTWANGADAPPLFVWKKLAGTLTHTVDCVCPDDGGLKHMSGYEVSLLAEAVKARMLTTGVGTYSLSVSAPATGTWSSCGSISDEMNQMVANAGNFYGAGPNTSFTGISEYRQFFQWRNDLFHGTFYGPVAIEQGFARAYLGIFPRNYSTWTVPGLYQPPSSYLHYMGWSDGSVAWGNTSYYKRYVAITYPAYVSYRYQSYSSSTIFFWGQRPVNYYGSPSVNYIGTAMSSSRSTESVMTLWRRVG